MNKLYAYYEFNGAETMVEYYVNNVWAGASMLPFTNFDLIYGRCESEARIKGCSLQAVIKGLRK